jgi:predicted transcriptional regulator
MNSRRSKIQIYVDILRSIRAANGKLKKTHIVYKANLTHVRANHYIEFLMSKGFIKEKNVKNQNFFLITSKGRKFLSEVKRMKEISDAFGVPL